MDLRRELILAIALLILINVLLAVGATALLARMGPAVHEVVSAGGDDVPAAVEALVTRLGRGGAWATVGLGFLSFVGSLVTVSLLQRRILRPVQELHDALESARRGDRLRRAHVTRAPYELRATAREVNRLLDERMGEDEAEDAEKVDDGRDAL